MTLHPYLSLYFKRGMGKIVYLFSDVNFILDCKKLVSKLINQCFSAAALRKRFEAFIDKHFYVWGKFGVPLSVNHVF